MGIRNVTRSIVAAGVSRRGNCATSAFVAVCFLGSALSGFFHDRAVGAVGDLFASLFFAFGSWVALKYESIPVARAEYLRSCESIAHRTIGAYEEAQRTGKDVVVLSVPSGDARMN